MGWPDCKRQGPTDQQEALSCLCPGHALPLHPPAHLLPLLSPSSWMQACCSASFPCPTAPRCAQPGSLHDLAGRSGALDASQVPLPSSYPSPSNGSSPPCSLQVTSPYYYNSINGYSYVIASDQHPYSGAQRVCMGHAAAAPPPPSLLPAAAAAILVSAMPSLAQPLAAMQTHSSTQIAPPTAAPTSRNALCADNEDKVNSPFFSGKDAFLGYWTWPSECHSLQPLLDSIRGCQLVEGA